MQRQKPSTSRSYLLPVEDRSFLLRDEMRAIRFASTTPKLNLRSETGEIRSTIIVFGGARVRSPRAGQQPQLGRRVVLWKGRPLSG